MAEDKPRGRTPDWDFRWLDKTTDERGSVGAAWTNPDGSIRIKLNPCVNLKAGIDQIYTLFARSEYKGIPRGAKVTDLSPSDLDDIPF